MKINFLHPKLTTTPKFFNTTAGSMIFITQNCCLLRLSLWKTIDFQVLHTKSLLPQSISSLRNLGGLCVVKLWSYLSYFISISLSSFLMFIYLCSHTFSLFPKSFFFSDLICSHRIFRFKIHLFKEFAMFYVISFCLIFLVCLFYLIYLSHVISLLHA